MPASRLTRQYHRVQPFRVALRDSRAITRPVSGRDFLTPFTITVGTSSKDNTFSPCREEEPSEDSGLLAQVGDAEVAAVQYDAFERMTPPNSIRYGPTPIPAECEPILRTIRG
ncbi:hypothetical protein MBLNU457_5058t1 [Dothideomycetes sp. NU457]